MSSSTDPLSLTAAKTEIGLWLMALPHPHTSSSDCLVEEFQFR